MRRRVVILIVLGLMTASVMPATQAEQRAATNSLSPDQLKHFSQSMRGFVLTILPDPLYEKSTGWGDTDKAPSRIKWEGQGLRSRPKLVYTDKNDGMWKRVRVTAEDPARHLNIEIKNVSPLGDDKTTFDVHVTLRAAVHYHQQNWQRGVKLWDATADARARLHLHLRCEATARFESKGRLIPELVYRLRVTHADVHYDEFELKHIAGVGGELAKLIGEAARKLEHGFKPSLEEKLLAKAQARIVRAGDTKEIRIGGGTTGTPMK
jgi:hypothetical protein